MPTPNEACEQPVLVASTTNASSNQSCPPEQDRFSIRRLSSRARYIHPDPIATVVPLQADMLDDLRDYVDGVPEVESPSSSIEERDVARHQPEVAETTQEQERATSPNSQDGGVRDGTVAPVAAVPEQSARTPLHTTLASFGFESTRARRTYCSSFLRPGSKFTGTQQSDKQTYNVEVTIKDVNLKESFLCGYLRIEGLTKDNPTITTYFESEIIGSKYTFRTKHLSWGAREKEDMQHWNRFPAWRPIAKEAKNPNFQYKNSTERENIFMRWKEYFLVPDHRVREISGASFEGFYYICFDQIRGTISGIYFHSKSEKFQQLELNHVPDRGCFGAVEFR